MTRIELHQQSIRADDERDSTEMSAKEDGAAHRFSLPRVRVFSGTCLCRDVL